MADRKPARPRSKRRILRWLAGVLACCILALLVDYWAYPYGSAPGGRALDHGRNGLWLRYTWYFGGWTDADAATLAARLREHRIAYAYAHVRSITREGRLKYRYQANARRLVRVLHHRAPGVKVLAWVYAGNRDGEGEVDLRRADVRARMAGEAAWLVRACGFDGVQWDYEICPDGDPGLVPLLRETRAGLPKGALLSVATPVWLPRPVGRWGWSDAYFAQVAAASDQLAVMCYDTGFALPRGYVWLTRQQVRHVTRDAARGNPACRVLIGLPTYDAGFRSHNPRAENVGLALRGVRLGAADSDTDTRALEGVALFADYTTEAAEWRTYDDLWLSGG